MDTSMNRAGAIASTNGWAPSHMFSTLKLGRLCADGLLKHLLGLLTLFNAFPRLLVVTSLSIQAYLIRNVANKRPDVLAATVEETSDKFGLPGLKIVTNGMDRTVCGIVQQPDFVIFRVGALAERF